MARTFYLTTPLYYVNDQAHIGHAYTTVLADVIARYHRAFGEKVHFLTGTDEHGMKIVNSARARGVEPIVHCDEYSDRFKAVWKTLDISYDDFIRTTEPRHVHAVKFALQKLWEKGDIYYENYRGWYCVPCERFWTEKDLVEGNCPDCKRSVEEIEEGNYFFRMSNYQEQLISYFDENPQSIQPDHARNQILGFLRQPLGDLCISRPKSRLSWGIELPFDPNYVCYVWVDALTNYITAAGYPTDMQRMAELWPADMHLMAKDIVVTHTIYWPSLLMALGLPPAKMVFSHGWWLFGDDKMAKSKGNVIRPGELIDWFGVDATRYGLMREISLGQDANFNSETFAQRINSELANDYGNLLSRTIKMVVSYANGIVPPATKPEVVAELSALAEATVTAVEDLIRRMKMNAALDEVLRLIREANRLIEQQAPWNLAKAGDTETLNTVLAGTMEAIRIASVLLAPVIPSKARFALEQLGADPDALLFDGIRTFGWPLTGKHVKIGQPLFPRLDLEKLFTPAVEKAAQPVESPKPETKPERPAGIIGIEDFGKVKLRVALVESAEKVEGADKLLKLSVKLGEERRTVVAGIALYYKPEELVGKKVILVANLEPRKLRGLESQGMLLAASGEGWLTVLTVDRDCPDGAEIR